MLVTGAGPQAIRISTTAASRCSGSKISASYLYMVSFQPLDDGSSLGPCGTSSRGIILVLGKYYTSSLTISTLRQHEDVYIQVFMLFLTLQNAHATPLYSSVCETRLHIMGTISLVLLLTFLLFILKTFLGYRAVLKSIRYVLIIVVPKTLPD